MDPPGFTPLSCYYLKVEQAFELSDASAERSASGCTVLLDEEPILEYLKSNVVLLRWLISEGYGDPRTLERRAQKMESWIKNPVLLKPDSNAKYAATIEIDLNEITHEDDNQDHSRSVHEVPLIPFDKTTSLTRG